MAIDRSVVDPATLTGYARGYLENLYELDTTLRPYLPDRYFASGEVKTTLGVSGWVDVAAYRAYDAELEVAGSDDGNRISIELPALGQQRLVSELQQLRLQGVNPSDATKLEAIKAVVRERVQSVFEAVELMRGTILLTGKAIIDQYNFSSTVDFQRDPALTIADGTAEFENNPVGYLRELEALYQSVNGASVGTWIVTPSVLSVLLGRDGIGRDSLGLPSLTDSNRFLTDRGIAPLVSYYRQYRKDRKQREIIPDGWIIGVPKPALGPDAYLRSPLGFTAWGRPLSATDATWDLKDVEQPGIVAGVWQNEVPPMGLKVIADAIALPVAVNADYSLAAKVVDPKNPGTPSFKPVETSGSAVKK